MLRYIDWMRKALLIAMISSVVLTFSTPHLNIIQYNEMCFDYFQSKANEYVKQIRTDNSTGNHI